MDQPESPFLAEARRAGLLTEQQAVDCSRIAATLAEVDLALDLGDIAERKGYLTPSQVQRVRRAVARFRVGKYEVQSKLGDGGTGVVWRARDVTLDRLVALKILSNDFATERAFRERFLREARVAVTLNHVRIVRGLDYGEADGYHFFAMELVEGCSLQERLGREGRLEEAEAFRITEQVVEALLYVRDFGLVHRDIKPGNILLTSDGAVKVCDLGLAKPSLAEVARLRTQHTADGTPHYMAPEQVRDPQSVDWRADVYSLGATLFHTLTGEPPFAGGDHGGVIQRHLTETPRDPRELVLSVSAGAAAVTFKMLRKQPDDRYATLESLLADLRAITEGRPPVHALSVDGGERPIELLREGASPTRSLPVPSRPRRAAVAVALIVGTAGLGLGAFELLGLGDVSPGVRRSQPAQADASGLDRPTPRARPGEPARPGGAGGAVDEARSAVAWTALETAARRAQEAGDDVERQKREYTWVIDRHAGTPAAEEARARVLALFERTERLAADELKVRRARADAAREDGDAATAWRTLDGFPNHLADTEAGRLAEEEARGLLDLLEARAEAAVDEARAAWEAHHFGRANEALETMRPLAADFPTIGTVLADATVALAEARQSHAEDRVSQRPLFVRIYRELMRIAGIEGVRSSLSRVERRLESERLSAYEPELRMLRDDLEGVARLRDAIRRSWGYLSRSPDALDLSLTDGAKLRGVPADVDEGSLLLRTPAREVVRVRPLELHAESVREVTREGRGYEGPYELDLFRLALAAGDIATATTLAQGLVANPAEHAGANERLEWVREILQLEVDESVETARRARASGDVDRAEELLRDSVAKLPDEPGARIELGALLREKGRLRDALTVLNDATEIPGCPAEAHLELALVLRQNGESETAAAALGVFLQRALADAPRRGEGETLLAEIRRAATAREVAELVRKGLSRQRVRRPDQAEGWFRAALDLDAQSKEALLGLGQILSRRGTAHAFEAVSVLRRYLRAATDGARARGEATAVIDDLRSQFGQPSLATNGSTQRAFSALQSGQFDVAAEHYGRAIEAAPLLLSARLGLADTRFGRARDSGWPRIDVERAREAYGDALVIEPDDTAALAGHADALLRLGAPERAIEEAERALAARETDIRARLVLGFARLALHETDAAMRAFDRAHELAPSAESRFGQALAYEQQGRLAAALSALQDVTETYGVPHFLREEYDTMRSRLEP